MRRWACAALAAACGCQGALRTAAVCDPQPHENRQFLAPEYICQPPDVLAIDIEPAATAGKTLRAGDEVFVVAGGEEVKPLEDATLVGPDGTLTLPPFELRLVKSESKTLPPIPVAGLTTLAARSKILGAMKTAAIGTRAYVQVNSRASPALSGLYLVRPDGRIKVGRYGVYAAAGLSPEQIEKNIRERLKVEFGMADLRVSVDVQAYNSSVYYVIADGGGLGDQMQVLPKTGRDRVLDVIGEIGGLPQNAGKKNIWISRPVPGAGDRAIILPVNWTAITKRGQQSTNYELLPGDRLFIKADRASATDTALAKFLAPIERIFGTVSLGAVAVESASGRLNGGAAGGS